MMVALSIQTIPTSPLVGEVDPRGRVRGMMTLSKLSLGTMRLDVHSETFPKINLWYEILAQGREDDLSI